MVAILECVLQTPCAVLILPWLAILFLPGKKAPRPQTDRRSTQKDSLTLPKGAATQDPGPAIAAAQDLDLHANEWQQHVAEATSAWVGAAPSKAYITPASEQSASLGKTRATGQAG